MERLSDDQIELLFKIIDRFDFKDNVEFNEYDFISALCTLDLLPYFILFYTKKEVEEFLLWKSKH